MDARRNKGADTIGGTKFPSAAREKLASFRLASTSEQETEHEPGTHRHGQRLDRFFANHLFERSFPVGGAPTAVFPEFGGRIAGLRELLARQRLGFTPQFLETVDHMAGTFGDIGLVGASTCMTIAANWHDKLLL